MKTSIQIVVLFLFVSSGSAQNSISDNNNQFAFDFLQQVSKGSSENVFFSPISISTAMGMTYAGTNGETQNQISKVFHFGGNNKKFHTQLGGIAHQLTTKADSVDLKMVNTLWAENSYPFKNSYNKLVSKTYGASVQKLDFIGKPEESRGVINDFVLRLTNNRIADLLPAGSVDNLTRLVLTNAVFFKAQWKTKFQKDRTGDGNFYLTPENPIKCKMMGMKRKVNYFEDETVQAIDLPYAGGNYSMLIILPHQNMPVEELAKKIGPKMLNTIIAGLSIQDVTVSIPKYKMTAGYQLKQVLSDMGMPQPFTDKANFSKMTSQNDLKISDVFHKAFIEVNEEGTEASAATAVVIKMKSVFGGEKFFTANRPYLFIIREKTTGSLLFLGKMADPSKCD